MDTGKQGLVGEGFEPCAHFQGARPGFVFKRGLWGVGYYHDLLAAPREAQPPPRAPDGVVRPQPQRCHYEVLGVAMEANDDELRRAYRRLALKWHPDKNAGNTETASAKFKEIQGAYAVLSDPQERAWYNDHREDILHGAADDASFEEEPGVNVWAYFTAGCYRGFGGDAGGFYAVYAGLFDELEAEERAVHAQAREAPHRAPPFGGPDAPWASVQRFYAHWEVFSTARVCGYADMYDPHQAPNRQSRRTMEKENLRCRAEARRKHTECVRALVAYVRKRDKRVAAHEAEHAAEQASRPSKKHAARVLALQQELAQLEAEEAAVAAEEAEAEEGAEAEAAGEAAHASREAAATASRTEADGSNAAPAADDEEEDDEDDEDEEDDAALLRLASAAVATKTGGGGRGGQQGEDTEEDDDDEEEEDEDALLRMAAMGGGRRPAAPAKVAADAAQALPLPEDATAAAPPAAPPTPPKPAPPGAKDTQLVVPDLHMTLDVAAPPAGTRQAGRPKGKGKQKDPAALAAAAAAAEGMRQRRAADGLGCKVCGLVFANRSLLLKHIEKTGHIVDPTRRTGMETGLHWIAPDDDQPTKQELMQMKKINDARAKKGRNRAAQNHRDSDPDF